MAQLGGREQPVRDNQLGAVPGAFVLQLPARFGQGGVSQVPAAGAGSVQPFLLHHAGDVCTFDHDTAVGFGQSRGRFVQIVLPAVSDFRLQPGYLVGGVGVAV